MRSRHSTGGSGFCSGALSWAYVAYVLPQSGFLFYRSLVKEQNCKDIKRKMYRAVPPPPSSPTDKFAQYLVDQGIFLRDQQLATDVQRKFFDDRVGWS